MPLWARQLEQEWPAGGVALMKVAWLTSHLEAVQQPPVLGR